MSDIFEASLQNSRRQFILEKAQAINDNITSCYTQEQPSETMDAIARIKLRYQVAKETKEHCQPEHLLRRSQCWTRDEVAEEKRHEKKQFRSVMDNLHAEVERIIKKK